MRRRVAVLLTAALALPAPFLFPDEGAYALLGRGLWHHGDLAVLGGPSSYVSALYPVFSALPSAVLRVVQARADRLANSCKEPPESSPQTDDAPASSTPSKSLPS